MIFSAFKKLFTTDNHKLAGHRVYAELVAQSRSPFLYTECAIPDTLDGRFDAIILHIFLLTKHLKNEKPELIRAVWEAFFADMDRSLREMGASDTGIGKRIKKMVQAFYGRIDIYQKTFGQDAEFKDALQRNLYRENEVSDEQINKLVEYVKSNSGCGFVRIDGSTEK